MVYDTINAYIHYSISELALCTQLYSPSCVITSSRECCMHAYATQRQLQEMLPTSVCNASPAPRKAAHMRMQSSPDSGNASYMRMQTSPASGNAAYMRMQHITSLRECCVHAYATRHQLQGMLRTSVCSTTPTPGNSAYIRMQHNTISWECCVHENATHHQLQGMLRTCMRLQHVLVKVTGLRFIQVSESLWCSLLQSHIIDSRGTIF